jgi:hypothetical protein
LDNRRLPKLMLSFSRYRLLAAFAVVFGLGAFNNANGDIFTSCGISLGEFAAAGFTDMGMPPRQVRWAVFTLGGSYSNSTGANDLENSDVSHDVGVAGGSIKLGSGAIIHGRLYAKTNATVTMNSNGQVQGGIEQSTNSNSILDQGVMDANRISTQAFGLAPNPPSGFTYSQINSTNVNYNVNLTSTCTVLNLTNFVMNGGTFTLTGTASQAIIINVTGNFSLTGGARIVLNGINWDSVLFNIRGTGNIVSFDQLSSMTGILLATQRTVRLKNGSVVNGEVIANSVQIGSNGRVVRPPVPMSQ